MPLRLARDLKKGDIVGLHVRGLVVSAQPANDGERIEIRIALGARQIDLICEPEFPFESDGEPASPSQEVPLS
ncbi:MAG: hypothetical protein JOY52_12360 [Hyphomicrobiales bacterium]|nr:hypothetical protein [Hyphomicrobiales bacterium]